MRSLVAAGVLAISTAFTGSSAFAQEVTLRFAHFGARADSAYDAAEKFAQLVSEKTKGSVEIRVFANHELGDDPTMVEGVRLGTIDLALTGNPYFTSFLPQLNVLDLPYLFQDDKQVFAALDGDVGKELMSSMDPSGIHGLAFWEIGFRDITNNVRPIVEPADVKGLKIRTTPNPAHVLAFKTLGANPTPMAFPELYSALQTGTIDGQENPINHILASRFNEVQRYMSLTHHAYTAAPLVINEARWKGLTDDQRSAIETSALEAAAFERKINDDREADSLATMKKEGMQIEEHPDNAAFRAAVVDVTRKAYTDQFGDDLLKRIDALKTSEAATAN